ncbi:MAG: HAD family phosphatase [Oligoflexia bacterium]|nr:HAD family phosphatase [Oligoflexia bacterium]
MREIAPNSLTGVLCDKDGTLVDKERVALEKWAQAAAEAGFTLPEQVLIPMLGRDRDTVMGTVREHLSAQSHAMEARIDALFEAPGAADAPDASSARIARVVEEVRAAKERYVREHVAAHGLPRMPGLDAFVEYLRGKVAESQGRILVALPTADQTEDAQAHLRAVEASDVFGIIVGADMVKRAKPDPETYVVAAKRIGRSPSECVAIEDSPAGLEAAIAAGCGAIIVIPNRYLPEAARAKMISQADFACNSLAEVPAVLDRLLVK